MLRFSEYFLKSPIIGILKKRIQPISFVTKVDDFEVKNEPILQYLKDSKERKELFDAIAKYKDSCVEIPIVVGNEEIRSGDVKYQVMPSDHGKKIAKYYWAGADVIQKAISESQRIRAEWEATPLSERIKLFLKAADLVSGKYRMDLNATTMLGQAKNIMQAEIDAAAELADFFRYNAYFAKELSKYQPLSPDPNVTKNLFRFRGLEGFIASISPFNFTAIGGNLASGPTLMGNVVLWKPSDTALLSNYTIFKLLREAGFPPGVINFIPSDGPVFGEVVTTSPHLAGINFTGSLRTFRLLWKLTAHCIDTYRNFPRLVGECGGKNFHFVHKSADIQTVVSSSIRSAFEYSGQKCSALDRMYVPESLWPQIKKGLLEIRDQIKVGSPLDPETFVSAVIDDRAFKKIKSFIDHAKSSSDLTILAGGTCDDSKGYFIEPTIIETKNPLDLIMQEEIFGPLLVVYVYKDAAVQEALELVRINQYALTGAIFAQDRDFIAHASEFLKMTAGNFYINDKSTGSVVGQQPFGGGRLSGTNDKAGGPHYMLRWTSPQTVKETLVPLSEWKYPYMSA
ncbi:delta-1-pyrroline-5-carboxylate dehydrogenase, mitochondrial-like isoform X1 [Stegodyphus dumicola]|uniref:delta-1-pyrroline-5-carboxylate dehydrogenase, mitochondrial-like isoform X1 n=1 Tax=Stegodyphus dumicola TaxID=202533 RepID=UPI0015B029CD|nr:delta-1-pyrroline-5-carboxylate dehydrogenase, mitochondrial-like isoform X1 [Stegodyphus dumicola]